MNKKFLFSLLLNYHIGQKKEANYSKAKQANTLESTTENTMRIRNATSVKIFRRKMKYSRLFFGDKNLVSCQDKNKYLS